MVCEFILGWLNVAYYLKVYLTLTFDLNHQKLLALSSTSSAKIIKYVRVHQKMVEWYLLFLGKCDIDLDLLNKNCFSGACPLYQIS